MDEEKMTCERLDEILSSYLENDLPTDAREEARAHLSSCPRCAMLIADIGVLRDDAVALPLLAPSCDLWPAINARIQPDTISFEHARASRRSSVVRLSWLMAAAASLVLTTAGITYVATRQISSASNVLTTRPASGSPDTASARLAVTTPDQPATAGTVPAAAVGYDAAIAQLEAIVSGRRAELDPATIDIIRQNLSIIDAAIARSRAALARDPASHLLTEQVNSALAMKVELLRTAALLPPRA